MTHSSTDGNPTPDPGLGVPEHGARDLADVSIDSYSLELEDETGLVGDQASQTAFREVLAAWREHMAAAGDDPLGSTPTESMSKGELDRIARDGDGRSARTVAAAVGDFAERLAGVIRRFAREPAWQDVQRIVIGGGFKQSEVGRLAIARTAERLAALGLPIDLRPLHHEADDAGLIGWVHATPAALRAPVANPPALLAVDIGGTNLRCGIVGFDADRPDDMAAVRVVKRELWRHADGDLQRNDMVEGIVAMLQGLIGHAQQHGIALAPFVGVACPGIIRPDGSIARGAQNLPGDWHGASFHLSRRLREDIPRIGNAGTMVLMHNDAVIQGLSELPFLKDVRRWAVLTIGTGLGNASYTNQH